MSFWHTSTLIALGVDEPRRISAIPVLERDDGKAVWWVATVGCAAALNRQDREGSLTPTNVSALFGRLHPLSRTWYDFRPTRRVEGADERLFRMHPLRAADALQLAAALAGSGPATTSAASESRPS